ncbi:MAG: ParB/RepB/Spo0J family partition protein [Proteobacteria bacterium]|nr:ParB/RepB/Spo0J family partition protein [Pseudomonadota bacterium]
MKKKEKEKVRPVRRNVLGRGLDALLPDLPADAEVDRERDVPFFLCPVGEIRPNRFQPRRRFAEEELAELSQSIQEQGVLQPLVVREAAGGYELVAGERRLRAARMAGLSSVPVMVRDFTDQEVLFATIVENIQRESLNPLETSEGYHRLVSEFSLTQEEVARRVGKKRSTVANFLRLRSLPGQVQEDILSGELSMGHARTICGLPTAAKQLAAARIVVAKGLSVRETEALVKKMMADPPPEPPPPSSEEIYMARLAEDLTSQLGTRVRIQRRGQRGTLSIEFHADDDLNRLIDRLRS